MTTGMTREELIEELFHKGFKPQTTASLRWKNAYFYTNGSKTLFILVRVHGIDLLETPLKRQDMVNNNGLLSVSMRREGDRFVEYNYTDSGLSIHRRILDVAHMFAHQGKLDDACFQRLGIGPQEWGAKYGEKSKRMEGGDELNDIYNAACGEPGEPAYLGDGVYITPGGKLVGRD